MATVVRTTDPQALLWGAAHNDLKLQIGAGAFFHLDKSEVTVTAANAVDLPTALVLGNQLVAVYRFHFADTLAHKIADVTALPALGACLDLATSITAANLMKASHNTHLGLTTVNYNADATNTIATANATILSDLLTLLNATKTAINAHMLSGPSSASIRLVSP
jgi:hypothetical protein